MQFFSEFSCPIRVWTEFGSNIFFLLLSLSHSVLAKNNVGKLFLNFFQIFYYFFRNFLRRVEYERQSGLKFFCHFFRNFLAWVEYERNSGVKFFSLFLGLSHPVLAKNKVGKRFLNFFNSFAIFLEFSCLGRVWTEFGSKIFFSLSRPISSRLG